jgi:hypothetical protein
MRPAYTSGRANATRTPGRAGLCASDCTVFELSAFGLKKLLKKKGKGHGNPII